MAERQPPARVPLTRVQGNIVPGFRTDFQALLFLQFPPEAPNDSRQVKRWLNNVQEDVATAYEVATFNRLYRLVRRRTGRDVARKLRSTWLNVAFTARGLKQLRPEIRFPQTVNDGLEYETSSFERGMCQRESRSRWSDDVANVATWKVLDGFYDPNANGPVQEKKIADALLIIAADHEQDVDVELKRQRGLAARYGLREVVCFRGQTLGDRREHFGFRDGLTQPDPKDVLRGWQSDPTRDVVAPGEFIRGCNAEAGHRALEGEPEEWERYGSYLVFRRLNQDVEGFWAEMEKAATALNAALMGTGIRFRATAENLAAKVVGRWRSGVKLSHENGTFPTEDPGKHLGWPLYHTRTQVTKDDFESDARGGACPLFSHVRKANPRDAGELSGEHDQNSARFHRILRRGIPYEDESGKGLLFIAYQASIEQGAEFIQHRWMNNRGFLLPAGDSTEELPGVDALVGQQFGRDLTRANRSDFHSWYLAQNANVPPSTPTQPMPAFITAEGGGYFFAPAIDILKWLASPGDARPAPGGG
jgi:Dyp-type peroxidase family